MPTHRFRKRRTPQASTTARGYGAAHVKKRRELIAAANPLTPCWRCGRALGANYQQAHLGHDDHDRTIWRGLEHVHCNLQAAARAGRQAQRRSSRTRERSWSW